MFDKLKEKLVRSFTRYVYSERIQALDERELILDIEKDEFESYKKSVTIADMVREQLHGFNPRLIDDTGLLISQDGSVIDLNVNIFQDALKEGIEEDELLAAAKKLSDDKYLKFMYAHLTRNQIIWSFRHGQTTEQLNFGRMSVNGVELVRDEIDRLTGIFNERNKPPEDFDKHEML